MPRPNRPMPGESSHNSGGGKFDLGSLLMSIYGGLDVNPEASVDPSSLPADIQGNAGPAVSVNSFNQTQQPYFKARTIFDKQRAAMANAEKSYGELQDQQEIANKIKLLTQEGPVQAKNQGLMNREGEQYSANLANQNQLSSRGQIINPQNLQTYEEMNTPTQQETTAQEFKNKLGDILNANRQQSITSKILDKSGNDLVNKGVAENFFGAGMATDQAANVPFFATNARRLHDAKVSDALGTAAKSQFNVIPEGSILINNQNGKPIFNNPDRMRQAMDAFQAIKNGGNLKTPGLMNNNTGTPSNTSPMNQPVGNGAVQKVDDNTIIIDGVVYNRKGNPAASFNPYSKF